MIDPDKDTYKSTISKKKIIIRVLILILAAIILIGSNISGILFVTIIGVLISSIILTILAYNTIDIRFSYVFLPNEFVIMKGFRKVKGIKKKYINKKSLKKFNLKQDEPKNYKVIGSGDIKEGVIINNHIITPKNPDQFVKDMMIYLRS